MKIFVHGMQSSGSSTFTLLLAQKPKTIAVLDLYCGELAPCLDDPENDIILKATITTLHSFDKHVASFMPDKTILFTRSLEDIVESLSKRPCRDYCGKMEKKIDVYKNLLDNQHKFDLVVSYDDMVNKKIDWISDYEITRTVKDVVDYSCKNSQWCRENYKTKWGSGGIRQVGEKLAIQPL